MGRIKFTICMGYDIFYHLLKNQYKKMTITKKMTVIFCL
ncbi:hypothetical protein SAMN05216469_11623 [Ruminococcus albus]|uniref:Uncharacterized protein n=1 Tax=Ruminococcus albus TaxID=1264 RepID=A0A1H7NPX8_RUMAL|nr:hypothetical protein SAMN05216469_11623 [Ruminococcus albus]